MDKLEQIDQKPMSVNDAWQGRRHKSPKYKQYIKAVLGWLYRVKPKKPDDTIPLFAHYRWGQSNIGADTDNPCKPFQDILFKEYWKLKSDHRIEFIILEKEKTLKKEEFIQFRVDSKKELIEHLKSIIERLECE